MERVVVLLQYLSDRVVSHGTRVYAVREIGHYCTVLCSWQASFRGTATITNVEASPVQ